jgi:endonuclease/exonuclease/phosphatase family metal-dependent hydrolase
MNIQIPSDQKLRVATLNLSNNTAFYKDRVRAVILEAKKKDVEVLLLQEISQLEKENIRTLAQQAGYEFSFISPSLVVRQHGTVGSSTGIFSRYPLTNADEMNLTAMAGATKGAYSTVEFNGHSIFVLSVHLLRGAENGYIRLKQATLIEETALRLAHDRGKSIVGGTFNDLPDGDSVRYLKGRKASNETKSAFWVDATEGSDIENHSTTRYDSLLGREAAEKSGIQFPELIPERKLDYLFVRGWVYGTIGMPTDAELFGISQSKEGLGVSDHYGVLADFWFPPKNTL